MTSAPATEIPATIEAATADQPRARLALAVAVAAPSHAYLITGPPGSGKRAAGRALAAELLAGGAPDPEDARRRALADPSPHPDLVWLRPVGTQHLVELVRERVIAAAAYRPFEGERRVFVIEAADAMAEESQNALLKTLEEPAPFAHLVLLTAEPEALLETVRSRCRTIRLDRLPAATVERRLRAEDEAESQGAGEGAAGEAGEDGARAGELELRAVARLADGDLERARFLASGPGRELREAALACVRAAAANEFGTTPWKVLVEASTAAGEKAAAQAVAAGERRAEESGASGAEARRIARETEEEARRASRRARTATLDLGLALTAAALRDLAAAGEGAGELILHADRATELTELAAGLDPRRARRAAELVIETRRRLQVNVGEELALEALHHRLAFTLSR